jgi:isopenicillin N synthase-like dioxygenase
MLYYPATAKKNQEDREGDGDNEREGTKSVLAGAHSDYGTLTLLFRLPGQPGLEILPSTSTTWSPVPVNPTGLPHPPILVNIGDLLSFWTSGLLKSTVHRVVKEGGEERYSMAYFCHPLDDVVLEAVPSKTVTEFASKDGGGRELESQRKRVGAKEGEVLTAKEHLARRLKVTYGLKE